MSGVAPAGYGGPPEDGPLVSCLMLTRERRRFAAAAVACFERQDYPARELVVLDDGDEPVVDLLPPDPRIRYVRLDRPARSLGAKRNAACEIARGQILVHWDDDDWHAPWRLSHQVEGLLSRGYELSGLTRLRFFAPASGRAWRYAYPDVGRPWLAGGTLCYTRDVWRAGAFEPVDAGEDTRFAWRHRSRPVHEPDDRLLVAMIHRRNASPKLTSDRGWQPWLAAEALELLGDDARRYADADEPPPPSPPPPLLSCVMPTSNRRRFIAQTVRYFLAQDYPAKELIVIDDGSDPVADALPDDPRIRYTRLPERQSIGMKRNLACELAAGPIIVQWDDDDWHGPQRLTHQVADILAGRADVTALNHALMLELATGQFWACRADVHDRMYVEAVHGGTLAFRREVWARCGGYPDESLAEDAMFLSRALAHGARLGRLTNSAAFVYLRHDANSWRFTCGTHDDPAAWRRVPTPAFFPPADAAFYRSLREAVPA